MNTDWAPRVTVAAVIEQQGRFLMVEEQGEHGTVFNQPAGHLEEGESLHQAVVRETLEETAGRFVPTAVVGIYRWKRPDTAITFLRTCFCGICEDFEDRTLDAEILQAVWMSHQDIVNIAHRMRSPMVLRCIQDYLDGKRYPLSLLSEINEG